MPEILENADERLTARMRRLLDFLWQEWKHLQLQIESLSEDLEKIANSDQEYVINAPDGSKKSATFMKWHGIYALFYVLADDVTVGGPFPEIPNVVSTLARGK